jgi:hypothetical protein
LQPALPFRSGRPILPHRPFPQCQLGVWSAKLWSQIGGPIWKSEPSQQRRVLRLQSCHQLFPQVYRCVEDYVSRRANFRDENPCELGLEKYVKRIEGLFLATIMPDESQGESPLLPLLNRTTPIGSTAGVAFNTTSACCGLAAPRCARRGSTRSL